VNGKSNPRDIDVLYKGYTEEEAAQIVRNTYPSLRLTMDLVRAHSPDVHVPCDTDKTNYEVLAGNPDVKIVRDCKDFTSILREGAGFEKALERLRNNEIMQLNIRETGNYSEVLHGTYSKGRQALQDSVDNHFGRENFKKLTENLWYGELLYRLSQEPPTNRNTVRAIGLQSNWDPENHALLNFNNVRQAIHVSYDHGRWLYPGEDVQTWIRRLYTSEPAYDWDTKRT
jgi:hypothetical protein